MMVMPEVFIEWRWGSLIAVCIYLASIRGVLQVHWDTAKMESAKDRRLRMQKEANRQKLQGAAAERHASEYEVDSNPRAVSEVIDDNLF